MKIIGIRQNYGPDMPSDNMPEIFLMCDSSLLKDGKPFFIPDFASHFNFAPTIVVHICRLGKNIARKFAPRYYDQVTVGLSVEASSPAGALCNAFDGAAIIGDFIDLAQLPQAGTGINYTVSINGEVCFNGNTAMLWHGIDEVIEYVSRFMTLKIGDYIFLCRPDVNLPLSIEQRITATIEQHEVLHMKVK